MSSRSEGQLVLTADVGEVGGGKGWGAEAGDRRAKGLTTEGFMLGPFGCVL